jgi:hypothetical protein
LSEDAKVANVVVCAGVVCGGEGEHQLLGGLEVERREEAQVGLIEVRAARAEELELGGSDG